MTTESNSIMVTRTKPVEVMKEIREGISLKIFLDIESKERIIELHVDGTMVWDWNLSEFKEEGGLREFFEKYCPEMEKALT